MAPAPKLLRLLQRTNGNCQAVGNARQESQWQCVSLSTEVAGVIFATIRRRVGPSRRIVARTISDRARKIKGQLHDAVALVLHQDAVSAPRSLRQDGSAISLGRHWNYVQGGPQCRSESERAA